MREVGKKCRKFGSMCILIHQIATDNGGLEKLLVGSTISLSPSRVTDRFGFQETVYSILRSIALYLLFCHSSKSLVSITSIFCGSIGRTRICKTQRE